MKNSIYTFAFLFLAKWCSAGEDPIRLTVMDVLMTAEKERRFVSGRQTLQFINGLNYRLPMVKSLGLRFGADDVERTKQQYAVNLSFNTFGKIRAQEHLKQAQFNLYKTQNNVLLTHHLKERYLNVAYVYFTQAELTKQMQLDSLLNTRNTMLKMAVQKGFSVRVKDLVEIEGDIKTVNENITSLKNVLTNGYQQIKEYVGIQQEINLNFDGFIELDKVRETLKQLQMAHRTHKPTIQVYQHKIELMRAELKVEETNFNTFFNNFQLVYETKPNNELSPNDFGIRLGFNIPIRGNFRPKQNELLLDMRLAQDEMKAAQDDLEQAIKIQLVKVDNLLRKYEASVDQSKQGLARSMLQNKAVFANLSAADIIDLKILQHEKEADLLKINHDIVREYLVLLDMTGDLSNSPLKNYLSNQFAMN